MTVALGCIAVAFVLAGLAVAPIAVYVLRDALDQDGDDW